MKGLDLDDSSPSAEPSRSPGHGCCVCDGFCMSESTPLPLSSMLLASFSSVSSVPFAPISASASRDPCTSFMDMPKVHAAITAYRRCLRVRVALQNIPMHHAGTALTHHGALNLKSMYIPSFCFSCELSDYVSISASSSSSSSSSSSCFANRIASCNILSGTCWCLPPVSSARHHVISNS